MAERDSTARVQRRKGVRAALSGLRGVVFKTLSMSATWAELLGVREFTAVAEADGCGGELTLLLRSSLFGCQRLAEQHRQRLIGLMGSSGDRQRQNLCGDGRVGGRTLRAHARRAPRFVPRGGGRFLCQPGSAWHAALVGRVLRRESQPRPKPRTKRESCQGYRPEASDLKNEVAPGGAQIPDPRPPAWTGPGATALLVASTKLNIIVITGRSGGGVHSRVFKCVQGLKKEGWRLERHEHHRPGRMRTLTHRAAPPNKPHRPRHAKKNDRPAERPSLTGAGL